MGQQTVKAARAFSSSISRLRIEHLWVSIPFFLIAWAGFLHPLRLLDFWWHLKVGEVIFTSRQIPRVDLFSFTRAGQRFVYQNWLGEVLYHLVYRTGGFPLLITLNTVLLLLAFVPILRLCIEAVPRRRVAAVCGLVAAFTLGLYSNMRPQVYSFVFFALFYYVLWGYREHRHDWLWVLPVLMVLWVNLHGAFILGILMTGLVLGAEILRRMLLGPRDVILSPSALAKLALILALILLTCGVNPDSFRVFAYVRQLQVDPASQQFVTEWQAPSIKEWNGLACFFGAFFLALLVFLYSRRRLDLTELGLFLAFAVLGLQSLRNGIWFALIVAPMLARHGSDLETTDWREAVNRWFNVLRPLPNLERQRQVDRSSRPALNWTIFLCLFLITVLLSPWVRPYLKMERLNPQLVEKRTPSGAMDYIAEHKLTGNIFHPQKYGDYLIWRLWPQQRSFIDGRVHLYDKAFVQDYILTLHDSHWESRLAKYDIKYLLLPKDDADCKSIIEDARSSENWVLRYEDDISILFAKEIS